MMSLISSHFHVFIIGLAFPVLGLGDIEIGYYKAPFCKSRRAYSKTYDAVNGFSVDFMSIEDVRIEGKCSSLTY